MDSRQQKYTKLVIPIPDYCTIQLLYIKQGQVLEYT